MKHQLIKPDAGDSTVLDHGEEFVECVASRAPDRYRRWLALTEIQGLLQGENAFNHGKLYTWAEFEVFRMEFAARFPAASAEVCINAFCRLFLKNDISLSNLVEFMEDWLGDGKALPLEPPDQGQGA